MELLLETAWLTMGWSILVLGWLVTIVFPCILIIAIIVAAIKSGNKKS